MKLGTVDVVAMSSWLPLAGAWTVDVALAAGAMPEGRVTLAAPEGPFALSGVFAAGGVSEDVARGRLIAGAGAMQAELAPKFYREVEAKFPLTEALASAGETLSASSDASALGTWLRSWTRTRGTCGDAVEALALRVGASWRFDAAGALLFGVDTFPAYTATLEHVLVEEVYDEGRRVYASDHPELLPGVTFEGWKVGDVIHRVTGGTCRTEVWRAR